MDSHIDSVMSRINEIEARLGMMQPAPTPPATSGSGIAATDMTRGVKRPFDVMVAQAGGSVHLQALGGAHLSAGAYGPQIESLIEKYASQNNLSPALVRAVIQQESGGNARSVSAVGAKGLMQLMPETAQAMGVQDAFDPEQNISGGTRLLSGLLREFKGDTASALAAYNAGSPTVRKYGGIPPFAETQQYVRNIMRSLGQESH